MFNKWPGSNAKQRMWSCLAPAAVYIPIVRAVTRTKLFVVFTYLAIRASRRFAKYYCERNCALLRLLIENGVNKPFFGYIDELMIHNERWWMILTKIMLLSAAAFHTREAVLEAMHRNRQGYCWWLHPVFNLSVRMRWWQRLAQFSKSISTRLLRLLPPEHVLVGKSAAAIQNWRHNYAH